jgi:phosphoribosyl 1,2-cyclic phosphodiesterase
MSDGISNMTRFHTTGACAVIVWRHRDTGYECISRVLLDASEKFDKVFVIAGNHECYGTTVQEALIRIDGVCSERPDVLIHMHNRSYNLDGYRILGTTLWSDLEKMNRDIAKFIADFRCIDDFTTATYRRHHETDLHWLTGALEQCTRDRKEAIVLTHHAPTFVKTSDPRNSGSALSNAFATNLRFLMGPTVPLWCSGHTLLL